MAAAARCDNSVVGHIQGFAGSQVWIHRGRQYAIGKLGNCRLHAGSIVATACSPAIMRFLQQTHHETRICRRVYIHFCLGRLVGTIGICVGEKGCNRQRCSGFAVTGRAIGRQNRMHCIGKAAAITTRRGCSSGKGFCFTRLLDRRCGQLDQARRGHIGIGCPVDNHLLDIVGTGGGIDAA